MADVTKISELSSTDIENNLALLKAMLADEYPSMDLSANSVFTQQVLRPAAVFHTAQGTNLTRYLDSRSLLAIDENPDLEAADATIVDHVLSNYNLTRRTGGTAGGKVTIVAESDTYLPIGSSVQFTANGVTFRPIQNYAGVPDQANVVDEESDLIFTEQNNDTWTITIEIQATDAGASANVPRGTRFTLSPSVSGIVDVLAAEEFSGGSDTETNTQLMSRLPSGISQKSVANRAGITAMIKESYDFVTDVSVIGAGDAEITRGGHNTLGIRPPGWADVYVRTRSRPLKTIDTKSAILQDKTEKTWLMTFTREQYSGLYKVDVLPLDSEVGFGSYEIIEDTRTLDREYPDGLDFTPDMVDDAEGRYSRYQTVSLLFVDPDTDTTSLTEGTSTNDYQIVVTYMPDIDTISDWLTARAVRHVAADYLVKAPIPCMVAVGIQVVQGNGDPALTDTDIQELQNTIADAVNAVDFAEGRLDASVIVDAAQELLPRRSRIQLPLDLRGQVLLPDGSQNWITDRNVLIAPDRPDLLCSPRTVAFYLDPTDVSISVISSNTLPV